MPRKKKEQSGNYNKAFPTTIRNLMQQRNTTQNELANYLKKTRQAVSYYCDGSSSPDWETIVKIANFFDVSTDYLLGRTEDPNRVPCAADELGLRPSVIKRLRECVTDGSAEVLEGMNMFLDVAIKNPSIFLMIHYLAEEILVESKVKIDRSYLASILTPTDSEIVDALPDSALADKSITDAIITSSLVRELNEKYPQYRGHINVIFGDDILEHRLNGICSDLRFIVECATGYYKYIHATRGE